MEAHFRDEQDTRFRAAVLKGKAYADRGKFTNALL